MTLDPVRFGSRLRDAREAVGYTRTSAAKELGISTQEVEAIEAGGRSTSTHELTQLADLYGQSVKTLLDSCVLGDGPHALVDLFRAADDDKARGPWRRDAARCFAICRTGAELKRLLGSETVVKRYPYRLPDPIDREEALQQGNDVAKKERERLRLGSQPITDMAYVINKLGIWATDAKLPAGMSGRLLHDRDFGMAILVNSNHSIYSKSESYAREYAHAILDSMSAGTSLEAGRGPILETYVKAFVGEFLLPEDGLRTFLTCGHERPPAEVRRSVPKGASGSAENAPAVNGTPVGSRRVTFEDVTRLAHHYRVAFETAVDRLESIEMIDEPDKAVLLSQKPLASRYLRIFFNEAWDRRAKRDTALMVEVVHLALEAYRHNLISGGRLRDVGRLLKLPEPELMDFAEGAAK